MLRGKGLAALGADRRLAHRIGALRTKATSNADEASQHEGTGDQQPEDDGVQKSVHREGNGHRVKRQDTASERTDGQHKGRIPIGIKLAETWPYGLKWLDRLESQPRWNPHRGGPTDDTRLPQIDDRAGGSNAM